MMEARLRLALEKWQFGHGAIARNSGEFVNDSFL
jgi:hypothetical protein